MDIVSIIAIGGIAMMIVGLIGGINSEKIKIPTLPKRVRVLVVLTGIVLLLLSVYLFPQSPFNPNNAASFQATQAAFGTTKTAVANLPTQTPAIQTISVTQPPMVVTRMITRVVEATPIADDKVLSIESIPSIAHEYLAGDADPVSSSRLLIIYGDGSGVTYEHKYSFPSNAKSYAGIIFEFDEPQNLSVYDFVELTIIIDGSPTYCSVALSDASGNFKEVPCQGPFASDSGITVKVDAGKQTTTIPLQRNYPGVTLGFVVKLYTVIVPGASEGEIDFKVSNIRFIKP